MAAIFGPLKSSANAGELSPDLKYKVGLKQFYSGAQRMKNLEPVPQSGFQQLPGTKWIADLPSSTVRTYVLRVKRGLSYILFFTPGRIDIWRDNGVFRATLATGWLTAAILPRLQFYGEANTIGVFERTLNSRRIFRDEADDTIWTVDPWPYWNIPHVDLGGNYAKTVDEWDLYLRFTNDTTRLTLSLSIDGNTTNAVELVNGANQTISPVGATDAQWTAFGNDMENQLQQLPGMTNDLTVTFKAGESKDLFRVFTVRFPGDLAGYQYQFDALVVSSADAAALVAHIKIGDTAGEALVSNGQGWFSGMELFQDRACYFAPPARPAAISMSQTGEYFNLDITAQSDNGARLEALRTTTSEEILHLLESTFLCVFTDQSEWFATNRVISRNEPVNFKQVSRNGTREGVRPIEMESRIWYVSQDGGIMFSMAYDDVSTSYNSRPESLLASHLVKDIKRMALQRKTGENNANRLWLVRNDGRLICAIVIETQEITAYSEWVPADGGLVKEVAVDGNEAVWACIERNGTTTIERMLEQETTCLQAYRDVVPDPAGQLPPMPVFDGKTVWVQEDGHYFGPYLVQGGIVTTDAFSGPVRVGLWIAPEFESMPYLDVLKNEDVVFGPGRVHSILAHVLNTQSLALGANGRPPKEVSLLAHDSNLDDPTPYSGPVRLHGLMGMAVGPTVTITQARPGMLRVQDFTPGVKH